MKSIAEILNGTAANTACSTNYKPPTIEDGEYRGADGFIHCSNCHGKRSTKGWSNREVRCICKCKAEEENRRREYEKQVARQKRVERLVNNSLMGQKYRTVNFENTEEGSGAFNVAFKRCKKYCEVADKVLETGTGIYLFGDKGVGKTRLTACMANNLMRRNYTTLFTNFSEISKEIRNSFGTNSVSEKNIINSVAAVDFLFIDDLGVERVTKNDKDLWLQEKIYDVINSRYNNKAPVIFTSNFSLRELIENRGFDDRTVDRIMETTEVMKIEGSSYRAKIKKNEAKLF